MNRQNIKYMQSNLRLVLVRVIFVENLKFVTFLAVTFPPHDSIWSVPDFRCAQVGSSNVIIFVYLAGKKTHSHVFSHLYLLRSSKTIVNNQLFKDEQY